LRVWSLLNSPAYTAECLLCAGIIPGLMSSRTINSTLGGVCISPGVVCPSVMEKQETNREATTIRRDFFMTVPTSRGLKKGVSAGSVGKILASLAGAYMTNPLPSQ